MNKKISRNVKNEIKDYAYITLGLILYTFGWTVFLLPYSIVTGGVTGISAIVFYATKIPIAYTYFIINTILLIFALKILGLKFLIKTIYAIIVLSLLLSFSQQAMTLPDHTMYQILGKGQDFMSLIIGCSMTGTALAIVFLHNGSTGGTDIIAACVNKYRNISLGRVLVFVDICIISSSYPIFHDWRKLVFGFCTMVIENFVLDYVMNAQRESVQFMIFSNKYQEIANAIGTKMEHGVTILDGHGWYTGNEVKVLCILARKRESPRIFRLIKIIDPNAFVSQSSVIGVYGEGFDKMKVKIPNQEKKSIIQASLTQPPVSSMTQNNKND
ncbi:membrane protein [Segatella asaccharophila]